MISEFQDEDSSALNQVQVHRSERLQEEADEAGPGVTLGEFLSFPLISPVSQKLDAKGTCCDLYRAKYLEGSKLCLVPISFLHPQDGYKCYRSIMFSSSC